MFVSLKGAAVCGASLGRSVRHPTLRKRRRGGFLIRPADDRSANCQDEERVIRLSSMPARTAKPMDVSGLAEMYAQVSLTSFFCV